MISIVKGGNLVEATQMIIAHQVNCMNAMGSGVAKAIREKYPLHYIDFMNDVRTSKLGSYVMTDLTDKNRTYNEHTDRIIFGLYGQYDCGTDKIHTDYKALLNAMQDMFVWCNLNGYSEVAMPYMIGSGLAGGDWNLIYEMIEILSKIFKVDVYLYDLFNQSEVR